MFFIKNIKIKKYFLYKNRTIPQGKNPGDEVIVEYTV